MPAKKKFNINDIKIEQNHGHLMKYRVYFENVDDVDINCKPSNEYENTNKICFARLLSEIKKYKINRIQYYIQDENLKNRLSDTEKSTWLKIAKKGLVIPNYVTEEAVLAGKPVIKISEVSPSLLYVYLTSLRVMQENQGFVRAMIYMVSKCRMDFCLSWVIASKLIITNSWHNIVALGRVYGNSTEGKHLDLEVGIIISLKKYLNNPWKYDKRKLPDDAVEGMRFLCGDTITKICSIQRKISSKYISDPGFIKAIKSKTSTTALKHMDTINYTDDN